MPQDFSISLQGYARAVAEMNRAARRIASPVPNSGNGDSYRPVRGIAQPPDYAAEITRIRLEKTAAHANLKALEIQTDVAEETLRLLGDD